MERLKIEDIVAQDKNGIVFRAIDTATDQVVAIRRFFPFGQNGGGLDKEEAIAFGIASRRLAEIQHVALRSIISGSVDPIDQIPYIVTEWVDGISLKAILSDDSMDPALVIDVLRIALEVSIILSHVLGEEAVWVETDVESIVVGTQDSGRGFTFWISPFKWLGGEFDSRKLSSIVTLGEELTGWKRKLVSDQAGHGLGGWLKWLRNNPDTSLREALESLAASTGNESPPSEETLIRQATKPLIPKLKQPSSKTPLLLTAAIALAVIALALFYLHKTARIPPVTADYSEQKISEIIVNVPATSRPKDQAFKTPPGKTTESLPKPKSTEADRVNALAEKLAKDAQNSNVLQQEQKAENEKILATEKEAFDASGGILSPDQYHLVRSFANGTEVRLDGIVKSVRSSQSGKSIYLNFSEPHDSKLINGLATQSDFKGSYLVSEFEKFIGKPVRINGRVFIQNPQGIYYVKVTSFDQIVPGQ